MTKIPIFKKNPCKPLKLGIFLSGSGTNFDAIERYRINKGVNDAEISFVFSNAPDCPGITKAKDYGIKTYSLSSRNFFSKLGKSPDDDNARILYDKEVINLISQSSGTDFIVLAGYRRKLSSLFYTEFRNRIINMYPGDITKKYLVTGKSASIQALENGDKQIKCTIYIDTEGERFGKAILQSMTIGLKGFTIDKINELDSLIREKAEWTTLPYALFEIIAKEKLFFDNKGNFYIDDELLPAEGLQLNTLSSD